MLTLKQINEISFRKSNFSGYKPEDVDQFIDEVSSSFTTLLKEHHSYKQKVSDLAQKNNELREKLEVLAYKVEEYKEDEDGIKDILLSAQKVANTSVKEATVKAEEIVAQANAKADAAMEEAKKKTVDLINNYEFRIAEKQRELDAIKAEVSAFRSNLYEMYRTHISSIEAIPDYTAELEEKQQAQEAKKQEEKLSQEATEKAIAEKMAQEINPSYDDEVEVLDDFDNFVPDIDISSNDDFMVETTPQGEEFNTIDFNAFSEIPESLKKEKESMYSTLEFGDDISIKK